MRSFTTATVTKEKGLTKAQVEWIHRLVNRAVSELEEEKAKQ